MAQNVLKISSQECRTWNSVRSDEFATYCVRPRPIALYPGALSEEDLRASFDVILTGSVIAVSSPSRLSRMPSLFAPQEAVLQQRSIADMQKQFSRQASGQPETELMYDITGCMKW